MATSYSPSPYAQALCPVCELLQPQPHDVFCSACRGRANAQINASIFAGLAGRFLVTICIESLLGIFTGFLLFIPIGAMSSGQVTLANTALLFGMNLVFIAPIIASLYTWTLRSWLRRAQAWATGSTVAAVSLSLLMFLAVFLGGLRLTTLPELILSLSVILFEWCIGVTVALWQGRLLMPPFQQIRVWKRWSVLGWSIACIFHIAIALLHPPSVVSLWLGTAVSFFIYGIISHCVLARFVLNEKLAARLQYRLATV